MWIVRITCKVCKTPLFGKFWKYDSSSRRPLGQKQRFLPENTVATNNAPSGWSYFLSWWDVVLHDVNVVRLASVVEQVGCYLRPWSFQRRSWHRICTVLLIFAAGCAHVFHLFTWSGHRAIKLIHVLSHRIYEFLDVQHEFNQHVQLKGLWNDWS